MATSFPAPTNAEFMLTVRNIAAFVIRSWNNLDFITTMHLTVILTTQHNMYQYDYKRGNFSSCF